MQTSYFLKFIFFSAILVCAQKSSATERTIASLKQQLKDMERLERKAGETLFTGKHLIFDYPQQFVSLEGDATVDDDRGQLKSDLIKVHFLADRKVEKVEATGTVLFAGQGYEATAGYAEFSMQSGKISLKKRAVFKELATGNQLAGEKIEVSTKEHRCLECGPLARLLLVDAKGLNNGNAELLKKADQLSGITDIRADHMRYDEKAGLITLNGSVWLSNPKASLESQMAQIQLSTTNTIVSVEASGSVVIQSDDRKALAEQVKYEHKSGKIELEGQAKILDAQKTLFGERIIVWLNIPRKIVCEPNAILSLKNSKKDLSFSDKSFDIDIRSDRLELNENDRLVVFDGNVRVRDIRGGMNCQIARLYFKEDHKIDWIEACNDVIIQTEGKRAIADIASYSLEEGKFVLEGTPKLKQGKNILTGDRIVFWQGSMRMICEPNARILLYPDEEMKHKFLNDLED